jgi:anti-anti-sigma factor
MKVLETLVGDVFVESVNLDRGTITEANTLKEILEKRISDGCGKFVVDLSLCEYIDSTFLGVLVNALKKAAKLEGDLKLVGFKPAVHAMFELTRLYRVFETFKDVPSAVKSFSK